MREGPVVERHISLSIHPDRTGDFERFFTESYRPAALTMPGLVECTLLREAERPDRYQMVFRWDTADHALAWRTSEVHQALQPGLNELHGGMEIIAYTTVL
jgi:heme-degrading monooxygenase HmoA